MFADALLQKDDVALVANEMPKPLSVNMGFGIRARSTTLLLCAGELQDVGVAVACYARLVTSAAIMGTRNALSLLKQSAEEGRVIERPALAVSFAEINELMGVGTIRRLEHRSLRRSNRSQCMVALGRAATIERRAKRSVRQSPTIACLVLVQPSCNGRR